MPDLAWREFIALCAGAGALPGTRAQTKGKNSFNQTGDAAFSNPLVFETFYHRSELFPGDASKPQDPSVNPKYIFKNGTIDDQKLAGFPVYNILDENNQIGQNYIFYPSKPPNPFKEGAKYAPDGDYQIMFEAKVNRTEYRQLRAAYPANPTPASPFKLTTPFTLKPGCIEIKVAWRQLSQAEAKSGRYLRRSPIYVDGAGKPVYTGSTGWGLLALHIIHKTPNYPDFIFASFEQIDSLKTGGGGASGMYYVANYEKLYYTDDNLKPVPNQNPVATYADGSQALPEGDKLFPVGSGIPATLSGPVTVTDVPPVASDVAAINNHVHGLIRKHNPNSHWQYYQLKGVQGHPTSQETDADYYLANIYVESSQPGVQLFKGKGGKTITAMNPHTVGYARDHRNVNESSTPTISPAKFIMGGCKGCHGNAQIAGRDFSFLLFSAGTGFEYDTLGLPGETETNSQIAEKYRALFDNR